MKERRIQILQLRADGYTRKEVAEILLLSEHTIADHSKAAQKELGAKTPAHAVAIALRKGIIQ